MLFSELLIGLKVLHVNGNLAIPITGIAYDSRKVQPGFVFVAVPGFVTDGHAYIDQAIANGAQALIVEKSPGDKGIPMAQVANSRLALAQVAVVFYEHPSSKLTITGVTGTNGKTTTAHLLAAIYKAAGHKTGLMGTIQNLIGGQELAVINTTPESLDLQQLLDQMVKAGVTHVVMEVSSHALALERTAGVQFDAAIFTNLSQDHLDFHTSMDDYAMAKAKFFQSASLSIINMDDARASEMISASIGTVVTYGLHSASNVGAKEIKVTASGVSFIITGKYGEHQLNLKLTGEFNVYNALAAFTTAMAQGFASKVVLSALQEITGVPGRLELVNCGQPFIVIVDYAHTPAGLENILVTAKQLAKNRLITLFGCGGDRDRTKRSLMGEIGGRYSDLVVITSDNPRSEDPHKIIDDILSGCQHNYIVVEQRRAAIFRAIKEAAAGDVVVIAGKGHETYQIIGKTKHDFDDRAVAVAALAEIGYH